MVINHSAEMPNQTPPTLFHYTNQAGLEGILKSKKIWATNIHSLKDRREFAQYVDVTETQLVTLTKGLQSADMPFVESVKKLLTDLGRHDIYTCSFCETGDSECVNKFETTRFGIY